MPSLVWAKVSFAVSLPSPRFAGVAYRDARKRTDPSSTKKKSQSLGDPRDDADDREVCPQ